MHSPLPPRPASLSAALITGTTASGLAVRKLPIGLPQAIVKHGGSILWALLIYWVISALRPMWTPRQSGVFAVVITTTVELSQLYHAPALDALRETTFGALMLGRVFSPWDVISYAAAVVFGVTIDQAIRDKSSASR